MVGRRSDHGHDLGTSFFGESNVLHRHPVRLPSKLLEVLVERRVVDELVIGTDLVPELFFWCGQRLLDGARGGCDCTQGQAHGEGADQRKTHQIHAREYAGVTQTSLFVRAECILFQGPPPVNYAATPPPITLTPIPYGTCQRQWDTLRD